MSRLSQLLKRRSVGGHEPIRTTRLVLRQLTTDDLPDVATLAGDWGIASMTARIPYPYTLADARQWLDGLEEGEVVRAIATPVDGRLLGLTGYLPSRDGRRAEIGYWIGRPYWGNGYATEAASALIAFGFTSAGFEALTCCHFSDNPASRRVIEKLGFKATGNCSCWSEARRIQSPAEQYELTRRDWRQLMRRRR